MTLYRDVEVARGEEIEVPFLVAEHAHVVVLDEATGKPISGARLLRQRYGGSSSARS